VGIARAGTGEGTRQGGSDGDAPRWWRDDGAVGSARDRGVSLEG
jgi:hypothetical protein